VKYADLKCVDPDSELNGIAANTALPAVKRNLVKR